MSRFVISPKHFNSVEHSIVNLILYNDMFYLPNEINNMFPVLGKARKELAENVEKTVSFIMDTLKEINVKSVVLLYAHHYKTSEEMQLSMDMEIRELKTNKREYEILTLVGLHKALFCINYQIDIDDLTEAKMTGLNEMNCYKFLVYMQTRLADFILTESEEWNNATYSIE